jgi:hypothetical protein
VSGVPPAHRGRDCRAARMLATARAAHSLVFGGGRAGGVWSASLSSAVLVAIGADIGARRTPLVRNSRYRYYSTANPLSRSPQSQISGCPCMRAITWHVARRPLARSVIKVNVECWRPTKGGELHVLWCYVYVSSSAQAASTLMARPSTPGAVHLLNGGCHATPAFFRVRIQSNNGQWELGAPPRTVPAKLCNGAEYYPTPIGRNS